MFQCRERLQDRQLSIPGALSLAYIGTASGTVFGLNGELIRGGFD